MTIITSTPAFEEIGGGKARLLQDFHFWIDHRHYVIRRGFEWDGASIPHLLRWKYGEPFDLVHLVGGLIHDAIYANQVEYHGDETNSAMYSAQPWHADFTRSEADTIYRHTIRMNGCSWWQSWKEWFGVCVFGGSHWTKR